MKKNPRRVPITKADYNKAFHEGIKAGTQGTITMLVYALIDAEMLNKDDILALSERFKSIAECVAKGNMKLRDLEEILINEYGWEVEMC